MDEPTVTIPAEEYRRLCGPEGKVAVWLDPEDVDAVKRAILNYGFLRSRVRHHILGACKEALKCGS